MSYIFRDLENPIKQAIGRGKSILLLGPRQTGKTTLLRRLEGAEFISLAPAKNRLRYEKDPSLLAKEIEGSALRKVVIDEIQKVPELLDEVQDLIDRNIAQFILSGSSARKLRKTKANWLPGRVLAFYMDTLSLSELPSERLDLDSLLLYGSLPHVVQTPKNADKNRELESYVSTYLEEEIRAEAAVRQLGNFSRFLELAAIESGQIVNFSKMATDIGVSRNTIASYYQILEDCLIVERIDPLTRSLTRSRLTKSPKYLFFDLGVRRLAANEGLSPTNIHRGFLFEQFVGLELLKRCRLEEESLKVLFWRDPSEIEVDWVIEGPQGLCPIEVKLTDAPGKDDCKNLNKFLNEYPEATMGYIICQVEKTAKMADRILAVSWKEIPKIFKKI